MPATIGSRARVARGYALVGSAVSAGGGGPGGETLEQRFSAAEQGGEGAGFGVDRTNVASSPGRAAGGKRLAAGRASEGAEQQAA